MPKLCIDPGHGGKDSGGVGINIVGPDNYEKYEVLDIGLVMARMARQRGLEVLMTRTTDVFVSITRRWKMANEWGAELFLSIHTNAAGGRGIEVLYGKSRYAPLAKRLAQMIAGVTGWPLRRDAGGYYRPSGVGVIKNTNMPALLSESGFIDYPEENAAMDTPEWTEAIARAHVDFACQYLGVGGTSEGEEEKLMEIALQPQPKQGGLFVWQLPDVFTHIDNPRLTADFLCWLHMYNESPSPIDVQIFGSPELAEHPWTDEIPGFQGKGYDVYQLNGNQHFSGAIIVKASKNTIAPTITMMKLS